MLIRSPRLLRPHIFQPERSAATSAKALPPCFCLEEERSCCTAPLFPWLTLRALQRVWLNPDFCCSFSLFKVGILTRLQFWWVQTVFTSTNNPPTYQGCNKLSHLHNRIQTNVHVEAVKKAAVLVNDYK